MIHSDSNLPKYKKEVMDVWDMEGDGKHRLKADAQLYIRDIQLMAMRKGTAKV